MQRFRYSSAAIVGALALGSAACTLAQGTGYPPARPVIQGAPPVMAPPGSRASRALQPPPPALREAERGFENCVAQNRSAQDLWQATERVVAGVDRRDELRKVGERFNWSEVSRANFQRSERELAESWARYQSLGGTARTAEDVKRSDEPCRDARAKLSAALREAYAGDGSSISQTRSMPAPSGTGAAATGSVAVPAPSGSVPVPPPK